MKNILLTLMVFGIVGCSEFNQINLLCIDEKVDDLTMRLNLNKQTKKVFYSGIDSDGERIFESGKITTLHDEKYITSSLEESDDFYEFKIIEQIDEININCEFQCDTSITEWNGEEMQIACDLQEMLYTDIDKKQCLLKVKNYQNKLANAETKVRVYKDDLSLKWIYAEGDMESANCKISENKI